MHEAASGELRDLLSRQAGVLSRKQAVAAGLASTVIDNRVRSSRWQPAALPPRTRIEDTVLDLTQTAATFDDAFGWLCRAIGRRLTTRDRLRAALAARSRVRWRTEVSIALGDVSAGVHSPLELRYVTKVERAHGLPPARRQACVLVGGKRRYLDNLYEQAQLAVELDGQAAHPPEQRWADSRPDNEIAGLGILTLHYTWHDVDAGACLTAGQVGALLTMRGTTVTLRTCGPACTVSRPVAGLLAG